MPKTKSLKNIFIVDFTMKYSTYISNVASRIKFVREFHTFYCLKAASYYYMKTYLIKIFPVRIHYCSNFTKRKS